MGFELQGTERSRARNNERRNDRPYFSLILNLEFYFDRNHSIDLVFMTGEFLSQRCKGPLYLMSNTNDMIIKSGSRHIRRTVDPVRNNQKPLL